MSSAPLFTSQPLAPPTKHTPNLSPPSSCRLSPEKLTFLLDKCRNLNQVLQIHAVILRQGHENNSILNFKLQKSYSSVGHLGRSFTLFKRTSNPDVFLYTSIINAHSSKGLHFQAFELYVQMLSEGVEPNAFTFSSLLKSCLIKDGILLHSQAIKLGIDGNLFVRTGLLDVYAKGCDVKSARQLFDTMPERSLVAWTAMLACYAKQGHLDDAEVLFDGLEEKDVVCWNVMIDGYSQHGRPNDALVLFQQMLKAKLKPTEITVLSVLSACGQLGALELGKWVHSYIVNNRIQLNAHVGTALVDMYAKCGSLEDARLVFDGITGKDIVIWNSMIVGYAMHGFSQEALKLFDELCKMGFHPTDITFIAVLNACAHSGLVSEGKKFFRLMNDYSLKPKVEHYGCMVNLLGRSGDLEEAYELIKGMNVEPDAVIWGTLLSACRLHGNVSLGEEIGKFLIEKNLASDGTYVLLSNIYAGVGYWDGVAEVRAMMKERGIKKEPGCSSIEINNKVHEFIAGDLRHPKSKTIYKKLEEMNKWVKDYGYSPQTEMVLRDIGEIREKEQALGVHSERLAMAFGLISTSPGTTIKIVKNLRVCSECHTVTKLISKITGRRIVVRDRNRFHHFEEGFCSCGDYW